MTDETVDLEGDVISAVVQEMPMGKRRARVDRPVRAMRENDMQADEAADRVNLP